jgi:hypothetical protein
MTPVTGETLKEVFEDGFRFLGNLSVLAGASEEAGEAIKDHGDEAGDLANSLISLGEEGVAWQPDLTSVTETIIDIATQTLTSMGMGTVAGVIGAAYSLLSGYLSAYWSFEVSVGGGELVVDV